MDLSYPPFKGIFFKHRLDPLLKKMMSVKKTQRLSIIVQSVEGIDKRIERCIRHHGGKITDDFPFCNACCAMLPVSAVKRLEAFSQIYYLSPNRPVAAHLNNLSSIMACNLTHSSNLTGRNVNVALLDTGIYPHPDLIRPANRILYFKDFVNHHDTCYDDNGHGTFVAGIIAGNGSMSKGKYTGIAPGAGLIGLKVLNQTGSGWTSTVLAGMQWVHDNYKKYKIKLACLPLGCVNNLSADMDPLSRAAQVLWDSGILVCTSVGNNGPDAPWISTPGINPNIITVGALQVSGTTVVPGNPPAQFSSRGFTSDGVAKPDFVAPGTDIVSLSFDGAQLPSRALHHRNNLPESYYRRGTGTSAACAAITGFSCLLLEKYGNLNPNEIKSLLKHSSRSLNLTKKHQGYGLPVMSKILE